MSDEQTNPGPDSPNPAPEPPAYPPAPPAASTEPPTEPPAKRPSWKAWVAVGAGAAVVGAAAVFGISAASSSGSSSAAASSPAPASGSTQGQGQLEGGGARGVFRGGLGGFGTIASINGTNLTIKNQQTSTTTKVVTSSKTTVTTSATGTVDDIKVGDTVTVIGTGTSPNITATRVMDDGKVKAGASNQGGPGGFAGRRGGGDGGAPGGGERAFQNGQAPNGQVPNGQVPPGGQAGQFPGPNGAGGANAGFTRGVVKAVGDGTFTVTGINGTVVTVTTSSTTTVSVTKSATVGALKVGDQVVVRGKRSNGTITATNIREGAVGGGFGFRPGGASGTAPTNGATQ